MLDLHEPRIGGRLGTTCLQCVLRLNAVNDGSLIIRIPSPALVRFEREWRRIYDKGSDRDQPAFAIAYANLYGDRDPSKCGSDIWVIPRAGMSLPPLARLRIPGHDFPGRIPGHDFFS